jgi:hypothetical protein
MTEMRAQSFALNKPMLVAIPQTAGSMYMNAAPNIMILKNCGVKGEFVVLPAGAINGSAIMKAPINSVNNEPSSDRTAITVTPMERFKEASLQTKNERLGTARIVAPAMSVMIEELYASNHGKED